MKTMTKTFIVICLAGTLLALPARAEEVPDVVKILFGTWKNQMQAEPTYESIATGADGTITITKLAMEKTAAGPAPGMKMTVDEISLKEVSDEGQGLYEIGGASFTGTKIEVSGPDGMAFSAAMPEAEIENWYLMSPGENPTPESTLRSSLNIAKKMSSGKITIEAMGQTVTADGYESTWEGDPVTGAGSFTTKLGNVVIDESTMNLADPTGTLKQLGYSGLAFDAMGDGDLKIADGKLGLDFNFTYAAKDMATFKVSIGAADVPVKAYAEMQKARAAGSPPDFMAMLPELQNVSFSGFTLRFEDNSITKKVMPLIAAMQGMDEAAMVANAGAMVQMSMMQLNNQAFTDQVVGAINGFLKDPKSLTITLKPATPVKVMDLMTMNPANPGEAIEKLGVSVTAND